MINLMEEMGKIQFMDKMVKIEFGAMKEPT